MQHPDEGNIHAWLDGALPAAEAAAIEAHVATCAECQPRVAEARGLIAASSRIVGHLDAVPANVIPMAAPKGKLWLRSRWPAAIAAGLILAVGVLSTRDRKPAAVDEVLVPFSTPEVVRPAVIDSTPVSRPAARVEPPRVAAANRERAEVTPTAALPDSHVLPPTGIAAQKSTIAAAPLPAPPPAAADQRASAESRMSAPTETRAAARAVTGSVAGGIGAAAASAPVRAEQLALTAVPDSTFVGCYEMPGIVRENPTDNRQPAAAPPAIGRDPSGRAAAAPQQRLAADDRLQRFALTNEPAPTPGMLAVRQLDITGRPGLMILGAGWVVRGDQAVVTNADGRTAFTLTKTDSTVLAVSSGGARARVISCRK